MASAAIILGIVPATLYLAGSSTAETELLSMQRPLLAFLIGAGAPAGSSIHTFNYGDPQELIQMRPNALSPPRIGHRWAFVILIVEYTLALASIANLCLVSYQLCIRTISAFAQDTVYMPALWGFLAEAIHILARLRSLCA
jgi:hypothetical protein